MTDTSAINDSIGSKLDAMGVTAAAEVTLKPEVRDPNDISSSHPQITPDAPAASTESAPTRGPDGRFLPKEEAASPAAPAQPAAPAADVRKDPITGERLVKVFGIEVPESEAEATFNYYQEAAKNEIIARQQSFEKDRIEFERQLKEREEGANAILELAKTNPAALEQLAQEYRAQAASKMVGPRGEAQAPISGLTMEQARELVRAELQRERAEESRKSAEITDRQMRQQRFERLIVGAFEEEAPSGLYGDTLKENAAAQLAVAIKEGKVNLNAPDNVIKRQAQMIIREAKTKVMGLLDNLRSRQATVNQSAPPPVVGGVTMMPRQESSEKYTPHSRSSLNEKILARLDGITSSGSGTL